MCADNMASTGKRLIAAISGIQQMGVIYVARSAKFSKWASDAGITKNVFKIGHADGDPAPLIAAGWGGETDWALVKQREADGVTEEEIVERLKRKEKMVDPVYYPRLRGTVGVFKVPPEHVENHILVTRALAGESDKALKLKPADFADYLIQNALPRG
jgi:hypothetical protein